MTENLQQLGHVELEEVHINFFLLIINCFHISLHLNITFSTLQFVHSSINYMMGLSIPAEISQDLTKEDLETARKSLNSILCSVAMLEHENEVQNNLYEKLPNLEKSQKECIYEILKIRRTDIMKYMVSNLNSLNSSLLNNFNWRLKWILGSNTLSSYKEPLLQCDFVCKRLNDESCKQITAELNTNELDSIISCLEVARDELSNTE